jgi:hypothetical protein
MLSSWFPASLSFYNRISAKFHFIDRFYIFDKLFFILDERIMFFIYLHPRNPDAADLKIIYRRHS